MDSKKFTVNDTEVTYIKCMSDAINDTDPFVIKISMKTKFWDMSVQIGHKTKEWRDNHFESINQEKAEEQINELASCFPIF